MKKNYFYITIFCLLLCTATVFSQQDKSSKSQDLTTDGIGFYPNPVSNGKIYITSKSSEDKEVTIFDVLGKKVLQATVSSKELSIGNLSPGVYIIQIKEEEASATRKLIVK